MLLQKLSKELLKTCFIKNLIVTPNDIPADIVNKDYLKKLLK